MNRVLVPCGRRIDLARSNQMFASSNTCLLEDVSAFAQRLTNGTVIEVTLVPAPSCARDRFRGRMKEYEICYDDQDGVYVIMVKGVIMAALLPEPIKLTSNKLLRPTEGPARLSGQGFTVGPAFIGAEKSLKRTRGLSAISRS